MNRDWVVELMITTYSLEREREIIEPFPNYTCDIKFVLARFLSS